MDRATLASMIDHTLLAPEATAAAVDALCAEAVELGVWSVCVSPTRVPEAARHLAGTDVRVCTVVGFPSGAHRTSTKVAEAAVAVDDGATEFDMVVPVGIVLDRDWPTVGAEITAVRAVAAGQVLKVILESAALPDDVLTEVARVAADTGADFVKTSTGFHPSGGASVAAVATMRAAVGPDVGVKASGGVRDTATALAMIEAGATRIGASASRAILTPL